MIKKVTYLHDYLLSVTFSDKTKRVIDLYPFLSKSKHPLIRKFLNLDLFKTFRVEHGSLCWGDNEFDLDPHSIYHGEFDAHLEHA